MERIIQKSNMFELGECGYVRASRCFNVAVYRNGIDIDDRLRQTVTWAELSIHHFSAFDELFHLAQKHMLDLILFTSSGDVEREAAIIAKAKERSSLSIVPTVVYHPNADKSVFTKALEAGADDVLTGEWDNEIFGIKIQMFSVRSDRDLGVNPTSRLPGPVLIERELEMRISTGDEFAVCYLDIDNFKAYNDYYGYLFGDKVIRLTAYIVRDIVFDVVPDGFVGHIGGDDFIFVIPYDKLEIVNSNIIRTFDAIIPYKYKKEDRERGRIVAKNRRGEDEVFPLLTISISIIVNHDQMFSHVGEMSHMLADLKKYTKKLAGSNYMVERRMKY